LSKIKCLLVTGGHGFIGQNLINSLKSDLPIVVIDNLLKQVHPILSKLQTSPKIDTYVGSISDPKIWDALLSKYHPQVLIHLAAETSTGLSSIEIDTHTGTNVHGMAVMLSALIRHDTIPQKFFISSSRAVYGEGSWRDSHGVLVSACARRLANLSAQKWNPSGSDAIDDYLNSPEPHNWQDTPKKPTSVYGLTKAFQEDLAILWAEAHSVSLSILRFQNVYGPGQTPTNSYTGILGLFVRQAMQKNKLEVYEGGGIIRDFVFISDVVTAIIESLAKPEPLTIADVGSARSLTLLEIARMVTEHYKIPEPQIVDKYRVGDVRAAYCAEAGWLPGWRPAIPFEEGLPLTIDYIENFFA